MPLSSYRNPALVAFAAASVWLAGCGGRTSSADAASAGSSGGAAAAAPAGSTAVVGRSRRGTSAASGADTTAPSGLQVTQLTVAGHTVTAEVADTEPARERGLMDRDSLPPDHGMLFVYSQEASRSFWMRNTKIPLDIAFMDQNGIIVDIQHMKAESDALHTSSQPAMYALEMNEGWFAAHDVKVGARVSF